MRISIFMGGIALLFLGCQQAAHQKVQKLWVNAQVYTLDTDAPWAEAVGVIDQKIAFVGSVEEAKVWTDKNTEVIDVEGAMLLPGFISAHDHIIASNWISEGVSLHNASSKKEVLMRIQEYASNYPDVPFVRGSGWNTAMFNGRYPTAKELDEVVPDRPAFIIDVTGHEGWLNSAALENGNITAETPDLLPGTTYWRRDSNGNPTGVGMEFQWTGTFVEQGAWNPRKMIPRSVKKLHAAAVSKGMTTFMSPGAGTPNISNNAAALQDYEEILGILNDMDMDGSLQLRSVLLPWFKAPDANPEQTVNLAARLSAQYDGDMVRTIGVKIHPESGWFGRGAPLLENYKGTHAKGQFGVSPERISELVMAANNRNLDVVIHVEGDATVRAAIDAFEASKNTGNTSARNSLHHVMLVHPDDYQRILDLHIPVNITPQFTTSWSQQKELAYEILGASLVNERMGLYGELARDGALVTLSADYPSTPLSMMGPLFQIQVAITLTDPSDSLAVPFPENRVPMTLEEAIKAVTINGAWLLHMEDKIGSIEVGKYADFVLLEENLFDVPPERLSQVKVLGTILNGQYTFQYE